MEILWGSPLAARSIGGQRLCRRSAGRTGRASQGPGPAAAGLELVPRTGQLDQDVELVSNRHRSRPAGRSPSFISATTPTICGFWIGFSGRERLSCYTISFSTTCWSRREARGVDVGGGLRKHCRRRTAGSGAALARARELGLSGRRDPFLFPPGAGSSTVRPASWSIRAGPRNRFGDERPDLPCLRLGLSVMDPGNDGSIRGTISPRSRSRRRGVDAPRFPDPGKGPAVSARRPRRGDTPGNPSTAGAGW